MAIAPQRMRVRVVLETACANHPLWKNLTADNKETIVRRIERNCFEVTLASCTDDGINRLFTEKKFVERYSTNCNRVIVNIDILSDVGSPYLLDGIIQGKIDPYKVAELESKDLCPDASKFERDEITIRQGQKTELKVSTKYTCRKCLNSETTHREYQGRASDEASSLSIKCIHCENVWRI